jgi:hypothetical protein
MLSTKNVTTTSSTGSSLKKTLGPGNHLVTIYDLTLKPGFTPGAYWIVANVEGPNMGPDFDGFLKDPNNPGGPKFAGQVGKVRLSYYASADGEDKNGNKYSRDKTMLMILDRLAATCGVQDRLKDIDAKDWDDMISQAKRLFIGKQMNICAGGKAYTNKGGYTEYDLFLPKSANGKYSHTVADNTSSLLIFNEEQHIVKEKESKQVDAFEPVAAKADDDFNLF